MAETKVKKAPAKSTETATGKRAAAAMKRDRAKRQHWSIFLFIFGILLLVFAFLGDVNAEAQSFTDVLHGVLCGLFGVTVFFTGPVLIFIAIMISAEKETVNLRLLQLAVILLLLSGAAHILFTGFLGFPGGSAGEVFESSRHLGGGGVLGMALGFPLMLFGKVAAAIIMSLLIFAAVMISLNFTLVGFLRALFRPAKKVAAAAKNKREVHKEDALLIKQERERERESEIELGKSHYNPAVTPGQAEEVEQILASAERFSDIAKEIAMPVQDETAPWEQAAPDLKNPQSSQQSSVEPQQQKDLSTYLAAAQTLPLTPRVVNDGGAYLPADVADISKMSSPGKPEEPLTEALELHSTEAESLSLAEQNQSREASFAKFATELRERRTVEAEPEIPVTAAEQPEKKSEKVLAVDLEELARQYTLPPTVLLNDVVVTKSPDDIEQELSVNSAKLVETLKSFGVLTKIVGVVRGPSVTRYELQPAPGVQIAKITRLQDDIALNFASAGVRIEAPIPGKAAVGIEVPNKTVDTVAFRALAESEAFVNTQSKLGAAIGVDITGETIIADIAKMPHILIAGTTGSGKSVCVNSIIMSILFRSTPDEVRLLMIDPKAVEFMIYNGIPHLLIPVVTDPKKASGALGWAVTEMLARYKMFADNNVRDLKGYNDFVKKNRGNNPDLQTLPQIVIFIDELADLMMASPGEVEDSICRLAQMARAAGMHLVIATQRPSVNVVTGVIKANIPSRIALKVASQVDSRTIIDSAGAEKLLGKGDMLYFPVGYPKPMRVQGCWVSDQEVDRVVNFIKNSFTLSYDESVLEEIERQAELSAQNGGKKSRGADSDELGIEFADDKLNEAIDVVIETGQASTSSLQRRLKLGYGRAARLIDMMEEMGIVGAFEGSKPRQVLMTRQEWLERKMNLNN